MAFEPNKENFLARLEDANFDIANFIDNGEELQEIFWYLDARRANEITGDILKICAQNRKASEQIITNLAKLYPLSRAIVLNLFASAHALNYPDAYFLTGFDAAKKVHTEIIAIFKEVGQRILRLTREAQEYQRTIANLNAEHDRLEKAAQELQNLRDERDRLQREVNQLREDTDNKKLQARIEELETEKNQLEGERHRQHSEIEKREKYLSDVRAELSELEKHLDSSEELQMLRELFKKFPADAEG